MRVGIDAHMIGDHSGGNESFYTNIINNMNPPKNMEIILFVKKGADLSALTNKFKRIEFQESSALKRNFFELPKLCKEYELDLLHTQYFIPFNRPCPVVCTIHDICFEHYSNIFTKKEYYTQKLLIPYAAKKSKAVFTVSNHAKQDIASHYHIPESNLAGGNNIAIQRALDDGCDYIMLLNNDTVVDSSFLDEMKRYCNSKTVVVPKIYYFDEPSVLWYAGGIINWISGDTHHTGAGKVDDGSYDKVEKVEFASGCCILMNKNVIEKVGMLDESYFMYYEDTDFCARLKKETIDIVYVPTAKIWHKVGASSSGEYSKFTAYYMAKNRLKFISKYSHNNLQRAYLRTIASGIKGYILNRNSKVSIKALKDFIKEQRT